MGAKKFVKLGIQICNIQGLFYEANGFVSSLNCVVSELFWSKITQKLGGLWKSWIFKNIRKNEWFLGTNGTTMNDATEFLVTHYLEDSQKHFTLNQGLQYSRPTIQGLIA